MARSPPRGTSRGVRISTITCRSRVGVQRRATVLARGALSGVTSRPGPGVRRVLGRQPALAEVEGLERVDHDGGLVELLRPERRLDRARLRTVGVTAGVHRDRPEPDAG